MVYFRVSYDFHWFLSFFPFFGRNFFSSLLLSYSNSHAHALTTLVWSYISLHFIKQSKVCRSLIYIQMRKIFFGWGVCSMKFHLSVWPRFTREPFSYIYICIYIWYSFCACLVVCVLMYIFKGQLIKLLWRLLSVEHQKFVTNSLANVVVCQTLFSQKKEAPKFSVSITLLCFIFFRRTHNI